MVANDRYPVATACGRNRIFSRISRRSPSSQSPTTIQPRAAHVNVGAFPLEMTVNHYDDRAATLQGMNRESQASKAEVCDEDAARRAIDYTREDTTMVVSYLSSLNEQIYSLRRTLWIIVALVAILIIQRI